LNSTIKQIKQCESLHFYKALSLIEFNKGFICEKTADKKAFCIEKQRPLLETRTRSVSLNNPDIVCNDCFQRQSQHAKKVPGLFDLMEISYKACEKIEIITASTTMVATNRSRLNIFTANNTKSGVPASPPATTSVAFDNDNNSAVRVRFPLFLLVVSIVLL
jgi:hypothetical protein